MSYFENKVQNAKNETNFTQQRICIFSRQLQKEMRLTDVDLKDASDEGVHWDIKGFTIYVNRHPWNRWEPILEVVPIGIDGTKVGYSNTKEGEDIPSSWHYKPQGTATEILPPKQVQEIILYRIREML